MFDIFIGVVFMLAGNGFGLGEGGDFHHKCLLNALLFVYPQNCHRSTEPPLAPNPCYRFVPFLVKLFFQD